MWWHQLRFKRMDHTHSFARLSLFSSQPRSSIQALIDYKERSCSSHKILERQLQFIVKIALKDGAYYCYCAYVLRISINSGFLSVMLTNTVIFLRGLKPEKVDLSKYSWYPKRKLGVTMHFWQIIKFQFEKERHTLLYILTLFTNIIHQLSLKNALVTPNFLVGYQ